MSRQRNFESWFDQRKFKHFKPSEFTRYFDAVRGGVRNSWPAESLWGNIEATLRVLDDMREAIGQPITITSSYRSPAYNKAVGGAAGSYHMKFNALDFQVRDFGPACAHAFLTAWRAKGRFKGGLGKYATFTHIDTRGYNTNF